MSDARYWAGWGLIVLLWATLFVIHMSGTVAAAEGCPAGTIQTPYGNPDPTGWHMIYQPNQPAAYVYVLTSDGTRLGPFPFGRYGPYGDGQWYVCYTEDVEPFRHLATPTTTTTATTTTTIPVTVEQTTPTKSYTKELVTPAAPNYGGSLNKII